MSRCNLSVRSFIPATCSATPLQDTASQLSLHRCCTSSPLAEQPLAHPRRLRKAICCGQCARHSCPAPACTRALAPNQLRGGPAAPMPGRMPPSCALARAPSRSARLAARGRCPQVKQDVCRKARAMPAQRANTECSLDNSKANSRPEARSSARPDLGAQGSGLASDASGSCGPSCNGWPCSTLESPKKHETSQPGDVSRGSARLGALSRGRSVPTWATRARIWTNIAAKGTKFREQAELEEPMTHQIDFVYKCRAQGNDVRPFRSPDRQTPTRPPSGPSLRTWGRIPVPPRSTCNRSGPELPPPRGFPMKGKRRSRNGQKEVHTRTSNAPAATCATPGGVPDPCWATC